MTKLTPFFKDLLEKRWSEFALMEADADYSSGQATVFALVRACQKGNLGAIREGLDRVDGKVAQEIEVIMPKFIFRYPYATSVMGLAEGETTPAPETDLPEVKQEADPPKTHSLRDTLKRLAAEKRGVVDVILEAAKEIDVIVSYRGDLPESDPLVKAVIVAGLLKLTNKGKMNAVFEVLDQIDGKVADTYKVLGDDVIINRWDRVAPAGAVKNEDGIYEIDATQTTNQWVSALERSTNSGRFNR